MSRGEGQFLCVHGLPLSLPVSKHVGEQGSANFTIRNSRHHNAVNHGSTAKDADLQVFKVLGFPRERLMRAQEGDLLSLRNETDRQNMDKIVGEN